MTHIIYSEIEKHCKYEDASDGKNHYLNLVKNLLKPSLSPTCLRG